jgi:hypothetical protein
MAGVAHPHARHALALGLAAALLGLLLIAGRSAMPSAARAQAAVRNPSASRGPASLPSGSR